MRSAYLAGSVALMALWIPLAVMAQTPTTATPLVVPDRDALPSDSDAGLISDVQTQVTCDGRPIQALRAEPWPPIVTMAPPPLAYPVRQPAEVVLVFAIASDGRAHSVRKPTTEPSLSMAGSQDAEASLMGWRFPPEARADCRLEARPTSIPLIQADPALKARALAIATNRRSWAPALLRSLERPGDDCRDRPLVRTVVNVGTGTKPPPGARAWAVFRFDVDADGRVRIVDRIDSSPDPDVEAASRQALGETEYHSGQARTGCVIAFQRLGDTPPPGPVPMPDWRTLNRCTPEQRARLSPGRLVFPTVLQDRGIEGWALVRFDIASWGRVGGVEVLQSQPVASFGEQARQIIQGGRATPALDHAVGCVDRVVFQLGNQDQETHDED